MTTATTPAPLQAAEDQRMRVWETLDPASRKTLGQFFTPAPLAEFIASRADLSQIGPVVRVLDPGAGVGSLGAALVTRILDEHPSTRVELTAFEIDQALIPALRSTRDDVLQWAAENGHDLTFEVIDTDFVEWSSDHLTGIERGDGHFDLAIMNPPYAKIATQSRHRRLTARTACEVTNIYAAFVALAVESLRDGGGLVAITPRSFTNGPYFRAFRKHLHGRAPFQSVDLFESRSTLFADTDVLQENVVYALVRSDHRPQSVRINFHAKAGEVDVVDMAYEDFMPSDDPELFIHLRNGDDEHRIAKRVNTLPATLADLNVKASTGRVVDFRTRPNLLPAPTATSAPLIYPQHLRRGVVTWPLDGGKKPNALDVNDDTRALLLPRGHYVALKRFTSKEEKRRVSPTWVPQDAFTGDFIAFENHLNVYHRGNAGLDRDLAVGLTVYLATSTVDQYFRQFSGHTQVNATDLKSLRYPDEPTLRELGAATLDPAALDQAEVDELADRIVWAA